VLPVLGVLLVLLASWQGVQQQPIVVSAAISLTDALQEIGNKYESSGGVPVRFNFAASNVLARQIANGAPADIFISADEVQMNYAETAGAIDTPSRRALLTNRLAVVTPLGRGQAITRAQDLLDPSVRRIAIGDPAAVPAGAYAKKYLRQQGLWDRLQGKFVALASVRAALAAAESGAADAAVVYESDAAASSKVRLAYVVSADAQLNILYPAAITSRSRNRNAALKFLSYLQGSEARSIFERFKFGVVVSDR
jgi:molybdate transport system substrate-binding protein